MSTEKAASPVPSDDDIVDVLRDAWPPSPPIEDDPVAIRLGLVDSPRMPFGFWSTPDDTDSPVTGGAT